MKSCKIDFSKGSIPKHLWRLAFPTMIGFALNITFNIIDTIFVGRLGADAIAAVSIVFPVIVFMIALGSGTGIGASSLIARYLGSKKKKEASLVLEHAILIALFFTIIFGILGLLFAKPLFILIGATPLVLNYAMDYSLWIFSFGGFLFLFITLSNILRGEGDAKTPMKYIIVSVLINVILDPILIFGFGFIPALGVKGAAIATIIGRGIGCMLLITHILKGKSLMRLSFKEFKFNWNIIKEIFKVGMPSSLSTILMSIGMIAITWMVAGFGSAAIAAYGIGWKLESIGFHFALGMAIATITIVGFNLGAGKIKRAKMVGWIAAALSMIVTGVLGLIITLAPRFFSKIFTNDIEVINFTVTYIQVIAWFFAFTSLGIILESAFQGFGKGMPKFILTILRIGILALPLAFLLSKSFGFVGIAWGLALSNLINGLIAALWFKFSKFKPIKN